MEKFVDIVHFLHLEIHDAFGSAGNFFFLKPHTTQIVKSLNYACTLTISYFCFMLYTLLFANTHGTNANSYLL